MTLERTPVPTKGKAAHITNATQETLRRYESLLAGDPRDRQRPVGKARYERLSERYAD